MNRLRPGLVALLYLLSAVALVRASWLLSPVTGWAVLGLTFLVAAGVLGQRRRREEGQVETFIPISAIPPELRPEHVAQQLGREMRSRGRAGPPVC